MKKVWLTIKRLFLLFCYFCSKMLFFNFCFFHFSKFEMTTIKNLMKNQPFIKWISRNLMKFCYFKNIFDLHTFDNERTDHLKFFEISTEMHFVSLFFLSEGNITISLLMIYEKCTVVHYANLNSNSLNTHYSRAVEYAISFFRFLIYVYFNDAFIKNFMEKLSFFNDNFQYSFHNIVYYRILGFQTL